MFDKYYILYTDFTYTGEKISSGEINNVSKEKEKDPILFGAFVKDSTTIERTTYMGDKLYFIADWEDEYCDLTLDKLMREMPEVVHNLDKKKIKKALIEKKPKIQKMKFKDRLRVLFKGA